jgi:hypothetical protein
LLTRLINRTVGARRGRRQNARDDGIGSVLSRRQ